MKRALALLFMLLFTLPAFAIEDDCTYLAGISATVLADEPFIVKVVYCEMFLNRVKSEEFPDSLPAVCYSMGIREKLKEPTREDIRAAAVALHGYNFSCGALHFEKCDKIKRTPPEKRGGVRLYDWYFY